MENPRRTGCRAQDCAANGSRVRIQSPLHCNMSPSKERTFSSEPYRPDSPLLSHPPCLQFAHGNGTWLKTTGPIIGRTHTFIRPIITYTVLGTVQGCPSSKFTVKGFSCPSQWIGRFGTEKSHGPDTGPPRVAAALGAGEEDTGAAIVEGLTEAP